MYFFFNGGKKPDKSVLDKVDGAAAAYGLRKLRSSYTGSAIRVRRSSDNTELNIGFSGKNLDTSALTGFVGSENLSTGSEDLSTNLTVFNASLFATNAEVAPDGTSTADTFQSNINNGGHTLYRLYGGLVVGNSYTFSIYVKPAGITIVQLASSDTAFSTNRMINFDLTGSGAVTKVDGATGTITALANGWYRLSFTPNIAALTATSYFSVVFINSSTANYVPSFIDSTASKVILWGSQLNTGTSAQSYAKTTSTIAGNGFVTTWYDQSLNARNAAQATAANQPRIAFAGAIDTQNTKPAIYFGVLATPYSLATPSINMPQPSTFFMIRQAGDEQARMFQSADDKFNFDRTGSSKLDGIYAGGLLPRTSGTPIDLDCSYGLFNGVNSVLGRNGINLRTGDAGAGNVNGVINIAGNNKAMSGHIAEFIIYPIAITGSSRQTVEADQMIYFSLV